ncbi:MAG: OsmC family protein [Nitrospiria bacterium]
MIKSESGEHPYLTRFSNGVYQGISDTVSEKGGAGRGFRPHDLLEAAVASCINMTVRMYADKYHLPLEGVITTVSLDRGTEGLARFEYQIELVGALGSAQRKRLLEAAAKCPVRKTLSRQIVFEAADQGEKVV